MTPFWFDFNFVKQMLRKPPVKSKVKCLECDATPRGLNRYTSLCSKHQIKTTEKAPHVCAYAGCDIKPRDALHMFCYYHNASKQRLHVDKCRINQQKKRRPCLVDVDEMAAALEDD